MYNRRTALLALALAWPGVCQEKIPIPPLYTSIVITATPVEPALDRRNAEVFNRTLFSRDDQIFHTLAAGIDASVMAAGQR